MAPKAGTGPCLFLVTIRTARIAGTVLDARAAALSVGWRDGRGSLYSRGRMLHGPAHMTGGCLAGRLGRTRGVREGFLEEAMAKG